MQEHYTAQEAAALINKSLDGATFTRIADRHGITYSKIGRKRYYSPDAVNQLLKETQKCPGADQAQDSGGEGTNGQSCGRKEDGPASVAQARVRAQKLRQSSRNGSQNKGSDQKARVVHLNI